MLACAAPTNISVLRNAVLAVVYVSEGINTCLLDNLANEASAQAGAGLLRQFRDPTYHRTGFTIGGRCPSPVAEACIKISCRALRSIDLREHEASHPRVGVVDHISVHPLGMGAEDAARKAGMTIARSLGAEGLPVLLYGDLKSGRGLAEVRRSTTYFVGGKLPSSIEADLGPNEIDASRGVITVGCTPLVTNYNLLLNTNNKRLASQVTRRVRERDGGLRWVEALTLQREDGRYETACNLLRPKETTPAMVLEVAKEQADVLGVKVVKDYETGLSEEEALKAISLLVR
ncbi:unnamed protein product [Ascophyllum nodosum]